jgi:hypothetical protein
VFDGVSTKPDVISDIEPDLELEIDPDPDPDPDTRCGKFDPEFDIELDPELDIDPDPDTRCGKFASCESVEDDLELDDIEAGRGAGATVGTAEYGLGGGTLPESILVLDVAMMDISCGLNTKLNNRRIS